jgi:hypothetical protein
MFLEKIWIYLAVGITYVLFWIIIILVYFLGDNKSFLVLSVGWVVFASFLLPLIRFMHITKSERIILTWAIVLIYTHRIVNEHDLSVIMSEQQIEKTDSIHSMNIKKTFDSNNGSMVLFTYSTMLHTLSLDFFDTSDLTTNRILISVGWIVLVLFGCLFMLATTHVNAYFYYNNTNGFHNSLLEREQFTFGVITKFKGTFSKFIKENITPVSVGRRYKVDTISLIKMILSNTLFFIDGNIKLIKNRQPHDQQCPIFSESTVTRIVLVFYLILLITLLAFAFDPGVIKTLGSFGTFILIMHLSFFCWLLYVITENIWCQKSMWKLLYEIIVHDYFVNATENIESATKQTNKTMLRESINITEDDTMESITNLSITRFIIYLPIYISFFFVHRIFIIPIVLMWVISCLICFVREQLPSFMMLSNSMVCIHY